MSAETGVKTGVEQPQNLEGLTENELIAKYKESEYWNKDLPGHNGWTVGELMLQLMQVGECNPAADTPENLYQRMLTEEQNKK